VEITFRHPHLQRTCQSASEMRRAYGATCANKLMSRLLDLRPAPSLEDLRSLQGRCRELRGRRSGQLAVDISDGRRLVFSPVPGRVDDAALVWGAVQAIEVLEVLESQPKRGGASR